MTLYAGDEFYDSDVTSGPATDPEPEPLTVTVDTVERHSVTTALAWGTDTADGSRVMFAGDVRQLESIAEAVAAGTEPVAIVPPWAILDRWTPDPAA